MKKKLLALLLVPAFTVSFGQIELRLPGTTALVNGTAITVKDTLENDMNQDVEVKIDAKSVYSSSKTIRVKKIEKTASSTAQTSENAICWGICTLGVVWGTSPIVISDPLTMSAGQVTQYSGHVYPKLAYGMSTFRYVFYDQANTTDSTWVDVTFDVVNVNGVGVNEVKKETKLKLFPNPASTELNIQLNSNEDNKKIEIIDLLGKKVFSQSVSSNSFSKKINTSNLNPGVYFVSVTSNNKAIKTEKVVITN